MKFGSLFSGVGGFDLGLEMAGLKCKWQVEKDPFCVEVLKRHWPNVERRYDACFAVGMEHVDVIAGGDPCQGNSIAGAVHKSHREDVAFHFLRIVAENRPRFVVRENPSVVRTDAQWTHEQFKDGLERIGYSVIAARIRACCVGASHKRERMFLLAELPNANCERLEGINGAGEQGKVFCGSSGQVSGFGRKDLLPAPRVCRSRYDVPDYVHRITALGNAEVPAVAEYIGRLLMGCL